jgi:hypothetical protein
MQTWISGGGGGGGSGIGSGKIIKAENITSDTTVVIPDNYRIDNVVIKLITPSVSGIITEISIGDNVADYDNYVPLQSSVPSNISGVINTILINQTPVGGTTLTIFLCS